MIKLNKLGFLTRGSQNGINKNDIIERAYVNGYIHNDKVKYLHDKMSLDGKIFHFISMNNWLQYNNNKAQLLEYFYRIKVTGKLDKETNSYEFESHAGLNHYDHLHDCYSPQFNQEFINNYSICVAIDPVFGIPCDDPEKGIVTKLCYYLEQL